MIGTLPCAQGTIFPSSQMLSAVRTALEVELMRGPTSTTARGPKSKGSARGPSQTSGACPCALPCGGLGPLALLQPRRPGEDAQLAERLGAGGVAFHRLLVLALRLGGLPQRLVDVALVEVGPVQRRALLHRLAEEPQRLQPALDIPRGPGVGGPSEQRQELALVR